MGVSQVQIFGHIWFGVLILRTTCKTTCLPDKVLVIYEIDPHFGAPFSFIIKVKSRVTLITSKSYIQETSCQIWLWMMTLGCPSTSMLCPTILLGPWGVKRLRNKWEIISSHVDITLPSWLNLLRGPQICHDQCSNLTLIILKPGYGIHTYI